MLEIQSFFLSILVFLIHYFVRAYVRFSHFPSNTQKDWSGITQSNYCNWFCPYLRETCTLVILASLGTCGQLTCSLPAMRMQCGTLQQKWIGPWAMQSSGRAAWHFWHMTDSDLSISPSPNWKMNWTLARTRGNPWLVQGCSGAQAMWWAPGKWLNFVQREAGLRIIRLWLFQQRLRDWFSSKSSKI